jgi:hypothetical protein
VIAAEQHACRLVVPSSQRFGAKRWLSHKDHAAKALQKLAGPHLPATLKQLEKAIAKAGAELHEAQEQARTESRKRITADRKATDAGADVCAVDVTDGPAEICRSTTTSSPGRSRTRTTSTSAVSSSPTASSARTPNPVSRRICTGEGAGAPSHRAVLGS